MPELPEVETWRRLAESHAVGHRIESCRAHEDDIVFCGRPPDELETALTGARVQGTDRRGKYLWFVLDRSPWPLFHFGMTGAFLLTQPSEPDPAYTKLSMRLDHGITLHYRNKRRLGRVRLQAAPLDEAPVSRLGFDPTVRLPSAQALHTQLQRRRTPIKALLLNQSFAAGIGNWIADEVLYQARIAPQRLASDLSLDEVRELRRRLRLIIQRAIDAGADSSQFPRTWLFHHRWGRKPNRFTHRGDEITYTTIGGRTTAWVPEIQR